MYYIAKIIHSSIQITEWRCSNHLNGCMNIKHLGIQTFVKEWVV